ncbi:MAG: flagellar hook assembly protein FlgD [Rhodospirillales bacterium]|nr:flagellar hook assembly protein FlgD [Rhodospirillales bacterium]
MILGATSTSAAPAASKATTDQNKLTGDLNRFLTLLVTQLQNQDPLEPLDANQFTSQLVQFASVEQQINQNANLEKLLAAQTGSGVGASMGYLGKTVEAKGSVIALQEGSADATYTLAAKATDAVAIVRDASGKTVYSSKVDPAAGRHSFHWDGRTTEGRALDDGTYSLQILAKNYTGAPVAATQTWFGRVTGIGGGTDGAMLNIGHDQLRLADVLSVQETAEGAAATTH